MYFPGFCEADEAPHGRATPGCVIHRGLVRPRQARIVLDGRVLAVQGKRPARRTTCASLRHSTGCCAIICTSTSAMEFHAAKNVIAASPPIMQPALLSGDRHTCREKGESDLPDTDEPHSIVMVISSLHERLHIPFSPETSTAVII